MPKGPVELRVGGQTYRVVATADEADLHAKYSPPQDDQMERLQRQLDDVPYAVNEKSRSSRPPK